MPSDKKLFAVIASDNPEKLKARIIDLFPDTNLSVGDGQWLLVGASSMTTAEVAQKLSISSDESVSGAMVLSVNGYFGRAPMSIWEWLVAKMGDTSAVAG